MSWDELAPDESRLHVKRCGRCLFDLLWLRCLGCFDAVVDKRAWTIMLWYARYMLMGCHKYLPSHCELSARSAMNSTEREVQFHATRLGHSVATVKRHCSPPSKYVMSCASLSRFPSVCLNPDVMVNSRYMSCKRTLMLGSMMAEWRMTSAVRAGARQREWSQSG